MPDDLAKSGFGKSHGAAPKGGSAAALQQRLLVHIYGSTGQTEKSLEIFSAVFLGLHCAAKANAAGKVG